SVHLRRRARAPGVLGAARQPGPPARRRLEPARPVPARRRGRVPGAARRARAAARRGRGRPPRPPRPRGAAPPPPPCYTASARRAEPTARPPPIGSRHPEVLPVPATRARLDQDLLVRRRETTSAQVAA